MHWLAAFPADSMSTLSLLSSPLMTVSLASLSRRTLEKPGVIVRTFQHPSFRAGLSFKVLLLLLPGAVVDDPLVGCFPDSHAPNVESDCGGTAPYWLEAAQLGQAVAVQ